MAVAREPGCVGGWAVVFVTVESFMAPFVPPLTTVATLTHVSWGGSQVERLSTLVRERNPAARVIWYASQCTCTTFLIGSALSFVDLLSIHISSMSSCLGFVLLFLVCTYPPLALLSCASGLHYLIPFFQV